jgi:hypothetical protein
MNSFGGGSIGVYYENMSTLGGYSDFSNDSFVGSFWIYGKNKD